MSPLARLIERVPSVFIGPDAVGALSGGRGVLLGAKRPGCVDVLLFDAYGDASCRRLIEFRFEATGLWEVVGIGLPAAEFRRLKARLVVELVPGDVVLTEKGPSVHLGDTWQKAPVMG